jgi:exopolysaccharide biosynthesis polyprenyl glycosylphosphotransferase
MLREHDRSLRSLLLLVDVGICAALFFLMMGWAWGTSLSLVGIAASLALPLALRARGPRSSRLQSIGEFARQLLFAGTASAVILAAVAFAVRSPLEPTRLMGCVLAQVAVVGFVRMGMFSILRWGRRHGRNYRNVLVIGSGPRARELTESIARHPEWGLRLSGYVDEGDTAVDPALGGQVVHKIVDFPNLLREQVVDEVIAACPRSMLAHIGPVVEACSSAGVPLTVMDDLFGDYLPPPRVKHFAGQGALSFAPVHHAAAPLGLKRLIDVVGAGLGLLVAAPLLLVSAVAIKLTSRGPVLFRQIRCGLYGRPFVMYKLRTMVCGAEERQKEILHLNEMGGPVFKIRNDPRLTPVGRFLRIFSIDELPQLWNVLIGDMSLVGPRPPIPAEVTQYKTWERRRLSMRPGLTCLWQVSGRTELDFEDWVRLDLQYIDTWSIANDLKLLLLTIPTVLKGTGA